MNGRDEIWVDEALRQQLAKAKGANAPVGAVFTLRSMGDGAVLSPEQTASIARQVVERAAAQAHVTPQDLNILENLQSFVVLGDAELVQHIIEAPEVETAVANEQPEPMLIEPVDSIEATLDDAAPDEPRPVRKPKRRHR